MTGNGTSSEPYLITTIDELYEVESLGSSNTYFRLETDIDFNGTKYAQNFQIINLRCKDFDGNGHTIRNIYAYAPSGRAAVFCTLTNGMTIHDLTVENAYIAGKTTYFIITTGFSDYVYVKRCQFTCCIEPSSSMSNGTSSYGSLMSNTGFSVNYDLCTFIIRADILTPYPLFAKGSLTRCQVHIDLTTNEGDTGRYNRNALVCNIAVSDTYFFGKITNRNRTESSNLDFIFSYDALHSNVYQAVEYENWEKIHWNSLIGTTCFYNSDMTGDIPIVNDSGLTDSHPELIYGLTTEQCKDAEYLKSIGFLCEGE
jgi:hypothetical protein